MVLRETAAIGPKPSGGVRGWGGRERRPGGVWEKLRKKVQKFCNGI